MSTQDVENQAGSYQVVSEEERAMVLERRVAPRLGIHAREVKIGAVISERDAVMQQMAEALESMVGLQIFGEFSPFYQNKIEKALAAHNDLMKEAT